MLKKVLIALVIIILIGVSIYLVRKLPEVQNKELVFEEIGLQQTFQGKEYRIFSLEASTGGRRVVCEAITGWLNKEEVNNLAQKLIGEITENNKGIREILFFFYSDIIPAGVENCDVAEVVWSGGETTITMIIEPLE
jgi:hypothetical protein